MLQPEPLEEIEKLLRPYGPALPVAELVEEINRLFHDVHAADYDTVHPEIFAQLPSLWAEMTELAMANLAGSPLRVLDFGAGTGFASEQILRHVPSEYIERLTCYDLSEKMLAVCRSKIDRLFPSASYCANFEVLNSNPSSGPYNVLLTNSVLHHLADPVGAIERLHPVLSAGAVWLAGHEPSSRFFANEECRKHFERFKWTKLLVPRNYLEKLRPLVKPTGYEGVAAAATSNGMFRRMPPGRVISRLVDLRVAYSAQEAAAGFGMDFEKLAVDFAETWQLKWVRTYSFMGDIYESNVPSIVRRRCREVELKFPRDGSNFCAVWTRATQKILLGLEEGPTHGVNEPTRLRNAVPVNNKPRPLFWVLMVLLTATGSLVLCELVARISYRETFRQASLHVPDERLRYRNRGNVNGIFKFKLSPPHYISTNSKGLRESGDIPYIPPYGETRILFLGDSFTFGLGVNDREDLVRATEKILVSKCYTNIRCINMGISGSGASVQYLHYLAEGRNYKPKIVVIQVFQNDVSDDLRDNVFEVREGELFELPYEMPFNRKVVNSYIYTWLCEHSSTFMFVKTILREKINQDENYHFFLTESKPEAFHDAAQVTAAVWRNMIREVRKDGAHPFFLLALEPARNDSSERNTYTLVREICSQEKVCIISPTVAMNSHFADDPQQQYVSSEDHHWGPAGNCFVARLLSSAFETILGEAACKSSKRATCP